MTISTDALEAAAWAAMEEYCGYIPQQASAKERGRWVEATTAALAALPAHGYKVLAAACPYCAGSLDSHTVTCPSHDMPQSDGEEWRIAIDSDGDHSIRDADDNVVCDLAAPGYSERIARLPQLERENTAWQDAFNKHDRKLEARNEKLEALADAVRSDNRYDEHDYVTELLDALELTPKPAATNDSGADMGSEELTPKDIDAERGIVWLEDAPGLAKEGLLVFASDKGPHGYLSAIAGSAENARAIADAINAAIAQAKAEALEEARDAVETYFEERDHTDIKPADVLELIWSDRERDAKMRSE